MSNECYRIAADLLTRLFYNDHSSIATIMVAEANKDHYVLKGALIEVKKVVDKTIEDLEKEEKRMGLEAENTEYNLGHDVKYYTEE